MSSEHTTNQTTDKEALIAQLQAENARLQREVELLRQTREKVKLHPLLEKRRAGILLHITSLPATPGNGDLGDHAYYFIDFLKECGLSVWQMLPIHPTHALPKGYPHRDFLSPYQCQCVHAGNPLLINLEWLVKRGWLKELEEPPVSTDIEKMVDYRYQWLTKAFLGFNKQANQTDRLAYTEFKEKNAFWLEDFSLFRALKDQYSGAPPWWAWPEKELRRREPAALEKARKRISNQIEGYRFQQFVFFTQWKEIKDYAHSQGVYLFGDMPFFVAEDSVEVWAKPEHFLTDDSGRAKYLAGTPPKEDFFRPGKGQCWGNPLYNWKVMQQEDFSWWIRRMNTLGQWFDIVRLTHFRGFKKCWAIPRSSDSSSVPDTGHWEDVPGDSLFETVQRIPHSNTIPLWVAENISAPTKEATEVDALRTRFEIPQIKILQLAFDISNLRNAHFPHHYQLSDVVYTGTHDSRTTLDWFKGLVKDENDLTKLEDRRRRKQQVCEYLNATPEEMPWSLIKALFASPAKLAMIPMQDILKLEGKKNRMNAPGDTNANNWRWRFEWSQIHEGIKERLTDWSNTYERG